MAGCCEHGNEPVNNLVKSNRQCIIGWQVGVNSDCNHIRILEHVYYIAECRVPSPLAVLPLNCVIKNVEMETAIA
jgi:hypothetical protein